MHCIRHVALRALDTGLDSFGISARVWALTHCLGCLHLALDGRVPLSGIPVFFCGQRTEGTAARGRAIKG